MARAASVYSVSQVNAYIKNMFAQDFALSRISVKGEVSNCKYHSSGHIYFTLKDGLGAIQAVMFAGKRRGLNFVLEEGQQVVVTGSVEVYERDGRYQLYAAEITQDGTVRPIVIITSNAEKELPDAFLRRCIFHYIAFPDASMMERIIKAHYPDLEQKLSDGVLEAFYKIRDIRGLQKKPSTSEVLDWIQALSIGVFLRDP